MRHRTLVSALFAALLTFGSPAPASAQFDFGAVFQRAQMIANQATSIANQVRELRAMARQLSELEDQLDHMERAARGRIDALTQPFTDLAAEPVGLVRDGLAWSSDFAGTADEMAGAVRDFRARRLVHPALAHRPRHGRPGGRGRRPGSLPEPPATGGDARGPGLPALPRGRRTAACARLRDARRGGRARGHDRERAGLVRGPDHERQSLDHGAATGGRRGRAQPGAGSTRP